MKQENIDTLLKGGLIGLTIYGATKLIQSFKTVRNNPDGETIYFLKKRDGSSWEIDYTESYYSSGGLTAWEKAKIKLLEQSIEQKGLHWVDDEYIEEVKDFEDVDWYEGEGYYEGEDLVYAKDEIMSLYEGTYITTEGIEEYANDVYRYAVAKEEGLKHYDLEHSSDAAFEKLMNGLKQIESAYDEIEYVDVEESRLSRSKYIDIVLFDEEKGLDEEFQIRFSDHAAKPTYEQRHGAADFEVGSHLHASGGPKEAIKWLKEEIEKLL